MAQGTTATVRTLPRCDFCGATAHYDFKTKMGPWANGCLPCYKRNRAFLDLGTGKGQMLLTEGN